MHSINERIVNLESFIGQIALIFRTLYDLGIEKGTFVKDDFKKKFDELDLIDGVKDGKIRQ